FPYTTLFRSVRFEARDVLGRGDPAGRLTLGPRVPGLHGRPGLVELLGQLGAVLRAERALDLALVDGVHVAAVAVPAQRGAVAGGVAEPRRGARRRLLGLVRVPGRLRARSGATGEQGGGRRGDDRGAAQ